MKSSKAELEQLLRTLSGTGPMGLAQLERISGRNRRSFERWAEADPTFRELLAPLLLRKRGTAAADVPARKPAVDALDAALVEQLAVQQEQMRALCEKVKGLQTDLATALEGCKKRDALIELQRSRIAELEAGVGAGRAASHLRLASDEGRTI